MRCLVIVVGLTGLARGSPFDPPSSVEAAQQHYVQGKSLFADKRYEAAAAEFSAAYALDPSSKFLLFNIGLADRMAGACQDAIAAYQSFLDAQPPEALAAIAHVGIDRCHHVLDVQDRLRKQAAEAARQHAADGSGRVPPSPPEQPSRDVLGLGMIATGGAGLAASGVLYYLAHSAASDSYAAKTQRDYESSRDAAGRDQTASWIAAGIGGGLVIAGIIRHVTYEPVVIAPSRGGFGVAMELAF